MINVVKTAFSTPPSMPLMEMYEQFGITKLQAKVFYDFYGLRNIAIAADDNLETLLIQVIKKITDESLIKPEEIDYVIFAHTSLTQAPHSYGLLHRVVKQCGLSNSNYFGINLNKCASAIEALIVAQNILSGDSKAKYALLVSGDIAFTNQQRYLQNASITGDAAAAMLISNQELIDKGFNLIATSKEVYPEFYKGAWLNEAQSKKFEDEFPNMMVSVINRSILASNLSLKDIKFILPHNVNFPIWKKIASNLGCEFTKVYCENIGKYGHCFSTDFMINLASVKPLVGENEYIVAASVGFGLTFISALFQKISGDFLA